MIVRHTKMLQGTATSDKSPDTVAVKTGRYPGTGTAAQWSCTCSLSISRLSDISNVAIFLLSESKKSNIPFLFLVARYLFMTDRMSKLIVIVEFSLMKHVFRD